MGDTTTAWCRRCSLRFRYPIVQGRPAPVICGRLFCHAVEHWTPEDWAGRARMAKARKAAGRILVRDGRDRDGNVTFKWSKTVLDRLDREALERVR
jgi:hypothetical protein